MTTRTLTIAGFIVLAVGFAALAAYTRRPGARSFSSLGDLSAYICRDTWVRAGVLLLWVWLGWHFLART
jgi:hypothetical protein